MIAEGEIWIIADNSKKLSGTRIAIRWNSEETVCGHNGTEGEIA